MNNERRDIEMAYIRRALRREPRWTILDLWPIALLVIVLLIALAGRGTL